MPHSLAVHEAKCLEKWCMENKTVNMGVGSNAANSQNRTTAANAKSKQKTTQSKKRLATTAVIRPAAVVNTQFQIIGNKAAGSFGAKPVGTALLAKPLTLESSIMEIRKTPSVENHLTSSPMSIRPYRTGSMDEKRPGTVTLSPAGRAASLDRAGTQVDLASTCVCYVCGQRCSRSTADAHEKKCLHIWECLVSKLPPTIRAYKPQKLHHPSVDGTVDSSRLDTIAQQSSQRSQKVDCTRCRTTGIDLLAAREHVRQCGTKKPDRAPAKADGKGGSTGKPKRKKAKDREIYVSFFA